MFQSSTSLVDTGARLCTDDNESSPTRQTDQDTNTQQGVPLCSYFNCEFCSRQFSTVPALFEHQKNHRVNLSCSLSEQECGEEYYPHPDDDGFQHSWIMRPKCDRCQKTFSRDWQYQVHKKRCGNEPSLECDVCKKIFKTKRNLTEHLYIHRSEDEFKCRHCGKKYCRPASLKHHVRTKHRIT